MGLPATRITRFAARAGMTALTMAMFLALAMITSQVFARSTSEASQAASDNTGQEKGKPGQSARRGRSRAPAGKGQTRPLDPTIPRLFAAIRS